MSKGRYDETFAGEDGFRVTEAIVGMLPRFCSKVHVFMPRTRVRGTLTLYMWRRFYHNVDAMRGIHVVANVQILKKKKLYGEVCRYFHNLL